MKKTPLDGFGIRTCLVRDRNTAHILAFDPKLEERGIYYTNVFKWHNGELIGGAQNFASHTICYITDPEPALILLDDDGDYAYVSQKITYDGNVFQDSVPEPKRTGYGAFRSVVAIDGKAYAVGYNGVVYRLDQLKQWTRIDDGLPEQFAINVIHGFNDSDIYAAGGHGDVWQYNKKSWKQIDFPTNVHLSAIQCAGDGKVYIGGRDGMLIRGRDDEWEIIEHDDTIEDDIWDIEWFQEKLYISTLENVYQLIEETPVPVDFGKDQPRTCSQLSAADGMMWSSGGYDIMSFDGNTWTRIYRTHLKSLDSESE